MGREMEACWRSGRESGSPSVWGCEECGELAGVCGALDKQVGRSLGGRGRRRLRCCVRKQRSVAGSYGGGGGTAGLTLTSGWCGI